MSLDDFINEIESFLLLRGVPVKRLSRKAERIGGRHVVQRVRFR